MLHQVLREIEKAKGPVSLSDLSRRMGIEQSALEGMIAFWVRKGRLKVEDQQSPEAATCTVTGCGPSCGETVICPFVAQMPKAYSLSRQQGS